MTAKVSLPEDNLRNSIQISDNELIELDVVQFNNGKSTSNSDVIGFKKSKDYYRSVVEKFRFTGLDRVLDLMCGFGKWSVFLAEQNREVVGLDKNKGSINIAKGLADYLGLKNTTFYDGDVSETKKFGDASFDAVWIWAALIYVERGPCLSEVARILKPGGRLLVGQTNSTGRLLEKLIEGLSGDTPRHATLRRQALDAFEKGPGYDGRPNFCTESDAEEIFKRFGFDVIDVEAVGNFSFDKFKFPVNVHIVAEKK
jgi:ubiquinone/menaquinone biosynthesis C-methylase UbiE